MTIETPTIEKKKSTTRKLKEPKKYKVIVYNDNYTPMDFVIALLVQVFKQDTSSAINLTMAIHNEGNAVAGIYPYEIAEQKVSDASSLAKEHGHPLVLKAVEA
jgi:ATP-dependent Clp protease adaptor protein ClpS